MNVGDTEMICPAGVLEGWSSGTSPRSHIRENAGGNL